MLDKVFVYGTLKRGYGNNRLLFGERFLGEAVTSGNYLLHGRGIPFAVPEKCVPFSYFLPLAPIRGELWSVSRTITLAYLDALEGYTEGRENNFYNRVEITTTDNTPCYIYEVFGMRGKADVCPIINGCYEWRR